MSTLSQGRDGPASVSGSVCRMSGDAQLLETLVEALTGARGWCGFVTSV
jgi:hypothetical protein